MSGVGAEREGAQRIQSGLCADNREPNAGLELMNHDHDLSGNWTLNQLSQPGIPKIFFIFK